MQSIREYYVTRGLLDRRRKLSICSDYVEFENSDLKGREFTRMFCKDIVDFRHESDWIVWYKFVVGKQYSICFKDNQNRDLRVVFKDYFGREKEFDRIYQEVINASWTFFGDRIESGHLENIAAGKVVFLSGAGLNSVGVKLNRLSSPIPWAVLSVTEYETYYVLGDKNHSERHQKFSMKDYESEMLRNVVQKMRNQNS